MSKNKDTFLIIEILLINNSIDSVINSNPIIYEAFSTSLLVYINTRDASIFRHETKFLDIIYCLETVNVKTYD